MRTRSDPAQTLRRLLTAAVVVATLFGDGRGAADAQTVTIAPSPGLDLGPLEDQLEIVELEREILAFDPWTGAALAVGLGRDEVVRWRGVRGRVGLVVTDRRLLATVPGAARWTERELRVSEALPQRVLLGDRVALVVTDRRVLAFEGVSGTWNEIDLRPREGVLEAGVGTNVAVAATRFRVFGVAALRGGPFEHELDVHDELVGLSVHAGFATVTTRKVLLTFRTPDANWSETRLPIR